MSKNDLLAKYNKKSSILYKYIYKQGIFSAQ